MNHRALTDEQFLELRTELDEVKIQVSELSIKHNSLLEVKSEIEEIQRHAEKALKSLHEALA